MNDKQMLSHLIDFFTIGNHKCTLESLLKRNVVQTVEGNNIMIRKTDRGTQVDTAVVLEGDIEAENGVIHALDSVPFTTLAQAEQAYLSTNV